MERPESQFAQPWVNPSISATNPMPELRSAGTGHGSELTEGFLELRVAILSFSVSSP